MCKTSLRYHKSPRVISAASLDMIPKLFLYISQRAGNNLLVMSGPKRRLTSWVAPSKSSRLLSSNTSPKDPYRDPPHSARDQMMLGQETTQVSPSLIQDFWYKWIVLAGFGTINTEKWCGCFLSQLQRSQLWSVWRPWLLGFTLSSLLWSSHLLTGNVYILSWSKH